MKQLLNEAAHSQPAADGEDAHSLIADAAVLLDRMAHVADPEIARMRAKVSQAVAAATRAVTDGSVRLQRRTRDAISAGDGYVRERPWQAVGIAAAFGLLVGLMVRRR